MDFRNFYGNLFVLVIEFPINIDENGILRLNAREI